MTSEPYLYIIHAAVRPSQKLLLYPDTMNRTLDTTSTNHGPWTSGSLKLTSYTWSTWMMSRKMLEFLKRIDSTPNLGIENGMSYHRSFERFRRWALSYTWAEWSDGSAFSQLFFILSNSFYPLLFIAATISSKSLVSVPFANFTPTYPKWQHESFPFFFIDSFFKIF